MMKRIVNCTRLDTPNILPGTVGECFSSGFIWSGFTASPKLTAPSFLNYVDGALVEDGDRIEIDITNRFIKLAVPEAVLAERRAARRTNGTSVWKLRFRSRNVSPALKAYAAFTTSAARGAVRGIAQGQ
jgi:hypothetical protein